jgi:hypothetical protein
MNPTTYGLKNAGYSLRNSLLLISCHTLYVMTSGMDMLDMRQAGSLSTRLARRL